MSGQRGPLYDNSLRELAVTDLVAVCRWLGINADDSSIRLAESLQAQTQHADLIAQVGTTALAHVEFARNATPDLPYRMVEYRARIMRRHPRMALTQHVLVLAEGTLPEKIVDGREFAMSLHVSYLRRYPPSEFLADPSLAPLAVLAQADNPAAREATLRAALTVIKEGAPPARRHDLASVAAVLAAIHLDSSTIDLIGKETSMPISLEGTVGGNSLEARAETRVQVRVLTRLLQHRFGDDPRIPDLAQQLTARLHDEAIDLAFAAQDLDELAAKV